MGMDPVRANKISEEIVGKFIGGWFIDRYINSGKSAIVLEGNKDGQQAAVKVFDPELVDRFGKQAQIKRIERELSLVGKSHPHLVKVFDGGECKASGYLFIAMEFIDAPNLGCSLEIIPREKICLIISQIASAARFLEEMNLAHRDIKPENISISTDFSSATLLDLGVLRPFGDSNLTDEDARVFVGTLRYSSPEFLLRKECDSIEGWRSITFYQLGAVLHDLIMKRPIFSEFTEPYALLVDAVKSEKPEIYSSDVNPDLILLAQNCLVKNPMARLDLVKWNDFEILCNTSRSLPGSAKERVEKRALQYNYQTGSKKSENKTQKQIETCISEKIESVIRKECVGNKACPPISIKIDIDDLIKIKVIFAAANRLGLPKGLSIQFGCEIIDVSVITLRIMASACLSSGDLPEKSQNDAPTQINIFRGPLDSEILSKKIQTVLWSSIDSAQSYSKASVFDEETVWLNLDKELEV